MKKFWTITMTLALALSLVACGAAKPADEGAEDEWDGWSDEDVEYPDMEFTEVEGVTHLTYKHSETRWTYGGETSESFDDEVYGYLDGIDDPVFIRTTDDSGYKQENVFTFDEAGNMLTWTYRTCEGDETVHTYVYENGLCVEETTEEDGEKTVTYYTYNDAGDPLTAETYRDGEDAPVSSETNEYDANGWNVRSVNVYEGGITTVSEYEYDKNGELVRVTQDTEYDNGETNRYVSEYENNADGRTARNVDIDSEGETVYTHEYDKAGNEVRFTRESYDGYNYEVVSTYDANGNLLTSVNTNVDGTVERAENTYDEQGRPVREYSIQTSEGSTYESEITYVYE